MTPANLSPAAFQNRMGRLTNREKHGRWKKGRCVQHGSIEVRRIVKHILKMDRLKAERAARAADSQRND